MHNNYENMVKESILSIDPGGTTGVSIIYYEENTEPVIKYFEQIPGGLRGFVDWYKGAQEFLQWDVIVCESFTLRQSVKFPDLSPVYIIGALEALWWPNDIILQSPSQKHLCDDDRLKIMGMHKPGKGHANDAIRHGIIYLRNKKHLPTLKLGWKPE